MADINFDCPQCEQNLEVPPDMAGETIDCPTCKESIVIPAPPAATQPGRKKVVMKKKGQLKTRASSAASRSAASATPKAEAPAPADSASEKSRTVALLLCLFLGSIGVHRFYVGKLGTGIVQILTGGGFGIWVLIDFIMIIVGSFSDKTGLKLQNW